MSARHPDHLEMSVVAITTTAEAVARIASFLDMFPQPERQEWLRAFYEGGVVDDNERRVICEHFGDRP